MKFKAVVHQIKLEVKEKLQSEYDKQYNYEIVLIHVSDEPIEIKRGQFVTVET